MPHAVGELPHADPFHIQRDHAALGLVDAAELFVICRLACASVPVDIQYYRHFSLQLQRLVQQCRNPPPRHRLEFQFFNPVSGQIFNRLAPFNPQRGISPFRRATAKHHAIQHLLANGRGLGLPFLGRAHSRHVRHTGFIEHLHLFQGEIRPNDFLLQCRRHLLRRYRLHTGHPFFLRQCRLQKRRPTTWRPAHIAFLSLIGIRVGLHTNRILRIRAPQGCQYPSRDYGSNEITHACGNTLRGSPMFGN